MLPDHGVLAVGHVTSPVWVPTATCGALLDRDVLVVAASEVARTTGRWFRGAQGRYCWQLRAIRA